MGITHAITVSVPMRRMKKDAKLLTDCPRLLSNVAVSFVNRWMTLPSGVVSKNDIRVDIVALNSARCSVFAAASEASAHANVRNHDTIA